jgi:hypothetical protein
MSSNKDHFENIDFNLNWEYCCRSKIDDISSSSTSKDSDRWLSVTLPHLINTDKQQDSDNSYNCWYRKEFYWILSNQQSAEQVYLTFEPIDAKDELNINATIWINGQRIVSNSFLSQQNVIELTPKLFESNQTEMKNKDINTLVVCCYNTNLFLHVRLIVHGRVISTSGKLNIQEKIVENNFDPNDKNELNYTVRVNDDDGRIGVVFKNSYESESESTQCLIEPTIDEKETQEEVPHLSIVILIVGTRGDVQPFIASVEFCFHFPFLFMI